MSLRIYANETFDVRYDIARRAFRENDSLPGPAFTIRTLDYLTYQSTFAEADAGKQVLQAIKLALVSIDGDPAKAAKFVEAPNAHIAGRLFDAIILDSAGN